MATQMDQLRGNERDERRPDVLAFAAASVFHNRRPTLWHLMSRAEPWRGYMSSSTDHLGVTCPDAWADYSAICTIGTATYAS